MMNFIFDPYLVLYLPLYQLDGASFTSRDAHGHLCTVTGALWRPNGRHFDGTDDEINCGNSSVFDITDEITLWAWVKRNGSTSNDGIICKNIDAGVTSALYILTFRNDSVRFYIYDAGTVMECLWTTTLSLTEWYFVAATFNKNLPSKNGKLYVDGDVKVTDDCTSPMPVNSENVYVGRFSANYLPGYIGECGIYRRELSPLELENIRLATKWRYR